MSAAAEIIPLRYVLPGRTIRFDGRRYLVTSSASRIFFRVWCVDVETGDARWFWEHNEVERDHENSVPQ